MYVHIQFATPIRGFSKTGTPSVAPANSLSLENILTVSHNAYSHENIQLMFFSPHRVPVHPAVRPSSIYVSLRGAASQVDSIQANMYHVVDVAPLVQLGWEVARVTPLPVHDKFVTVPTRRQTHFYVHSLLGSTWQHRQLAGFTPLSFRRSILSTETLRSNWEDRSDAVEEV
jgi:hypothetical protein